VEPSSLAAPVQTQMSFIGSCGHASCIEGDAYFGSNAGTYDMWITGNNPLITATKSPNIFAVNMNGGTLNFNFSIGSSTITGTIQLTMLKDGTNAPQFLGTLTVFKRHWHLCPRSGKAGNIVPLDLTISLPPGSALVDQVVAGLAGSTTGTVSSGEIIRRA